MKTFYVLFDEFTRMFVAAGRAGGMTYTLNAAKHFTSEWSAENYKNKSRNLECLTVKKIVHY